MKKVNQFFLVVNEIPLKNHKDWYEIGVKNPIKHPIRNEDWYDFYSKKWMGPQIRGLVLLTLPIGSSLCAVGVVLLVVCWAPSRWCGRDGVKLWSFSLRRFIVFHGRFLVGFGKNECVSSF